MIKKLINTDLAKHSARLLAGSAGSQLILLAIVPLLSRLYSEEEFGVYFLFLALFNILKKISTLRFELAVVIAKSNFWAINALAVTVLVTFVTSLIFSLLIFPILYLFRLATGENLSLELFLLLPVLLFLTGFFEAISAWNNRQKSYYTMSIGKLTRSVGIGGGQIGFQKISVQNFGLIFGYVLGQFIAVVVLTLISFKDIFRNLKDIRVKRMKIVAYRYRKIPLANTAINVVSNFSNEMPLYMLSRFFSTAVSGLYGMAMKIAGTPTDFLSQSVGQVYFRTAAEQHTQGKNVYVNLKKFLAKLAQIGLIPFFLVLIISPFSGFIFGQNWKDLVYFFPILIVPIYLNFLVQPISSLPTIYERQGTFFVITVISLIIRVLSLFLGYYFFEDFYVSLIFLSVTTSFFRLYTLFWILKIAKTECVKTY